jgi:hypothetical protein
VALTQIFEETDLKLQASGAEHAWEITHSNIKARDPTRYG